jgi:hypothetical protein
VSALPDQFPVFPSYRLLLLYEANHKNLIAYGIYLSMKTFKKWLTEMAGGYAIVGCKDLNNPNFQVWGAMSDFKCKNKKKLDLPYTTDNPPIKKPKK